MMGPNDAVCWCPMTVQDVFDDLIPVDCRIELTAEAGVAQLRSAEVEQHHVCVPTLEREDSDFVGRLEGFQRIDADVEKDIDLTT